MINNNIYRKYSLLFLSLLTLLFFLPWFSSDMDNNVLTSTNIITGMHIGKYADTLSELAGDDLGNGAGAALFLLKLIYLLPALAVLSALLLLIRKRYGAILTMVTSALHILVLVIFIALPASVSELVHLMFVVTPTIALYGLFGTLALISSYLLLKSELRTYHESGAKRAKTDEHKKFDDPDFNFELPEEKNRRPKGKKQASEKKPAKPKTPKRKIGITKR